MLRNKKSSSKENTQSQKKQKKVSSESASTQNEMSGREMIDVNDCKTPSSTKDVKNDKNNNNNNQMQFEVDAFSSNKHFFHMKAAIDGFVKNVLQKGIKGLLEDFGSIATPTIPNEEDCFHWYDNDELNRYRNIFCWDKTRVVLKGHPTKRTYIHANIVGGPLYPDRFICAQGPLPDTCYDFWLMIFEQKIMSVLQLCRFIEDNNKDKCAVYYPQQKGETMKFGDIRIYCADVKLLGTPGTVYQRIFNVYKDEKIGKDVFHLSFETWPDHGVPPVDSTILTILQKVRMSTNHPILVHCSAGIGRTGTIVAIENILESLMLGKNVEPHEIVATLRTQRRQAVQREVQFLFTVRVVLEYFVLMKRIQRTPEIDAFFEEYEKAVAVRR